MKELWLVFVVGAALSWGCYVPTLHEGQSRIGGGKPSAGALRAFLCVGIAYFLTAVLVPLGLLGAKLEEFKFDAGGMSYATFAGVLGAAGALCIILSIKAGGKPLYVAPLVFAGAPIVNVLISMLWHKPTHSPAMGFYVGILMAAVGAGLVLWNKPA